MPMAEYRAVDALCNSDLQLFKRNAGDYIWSKSAPRDPQKSKTAAAGTMAHMLILEGQEAFDEHIEVADVKGRDTKRFVDLVMDNPDKTVLTEAEATHVKAVSLSAMCHPMFKSIVESSGDVEVSIFATDPITGLELKIRPDKIINSEPKVTIADVKTTAKLSDWRTDRTWMNPIFCHEYGFTAAFYMYVASIYYGYDIEEYIFPVAQTHIELGRYPASVFKVTKQQVVDWGFWDEMIVALEGFAEAKKNNDFAEFEYLPNFRINDFEEITVREVE